MVCVQYSPALLSRHVAFECCVVCGGAGGVVRGGLAGLNFIFNSGCRWGPFSVFDLPFDLQPGESNTTSERTKRSLSLRQTHSSGWVGSPPPSQRYCQSQPAAERPSAHTAARCRRVARACRARRARRDRRRGSAPRLARWPAYAPLRACSTARHPPAHGRRAAPAPPMRRRARRSPAERRELAKCRFTSILEDIQSGFALLSRVSKYVEHVHTQRSLGCASSSSSKRGAARSARAMAMRSRCPPESCTPRSPTCSSFGFGCRSGLGLGLWLGVGVG